MYETLLQSADRPFRATPDTKFYFPSDSIEQARQTVVRAVLRAEGPCLVLGGAGLGKTMLGQIVADDVYGRFDIVKLHASGLCSRRALLQSILFELQMPYRGLSEGELRMSIMDRLSPSPETAPNGVLLLVDEAHTLSPKLLEELRLITNFARSGQPRARLVLLGNMRLEDTFAHPQLDSFNQRLAARCYLQPMTRDNTMEFVRHQLRCVHIEPATLITNDALRTLFSASEGVPRLVNQVMDHALVLGITAGQCPLSAALIEEAWSDLQQLPAPWHSSNAPEKSPAAAKNQIEFGELSDDEDESFTESTAAGSYTDITLGSSPAVVTAAIDDSPVYSSLYRDNLTADIEEEYELALSDEPLEVITKAPKQNFFAAFAPIATIEPIVADDEDEAEISAEDQFLTEITSDSVTSLAQPTATPTFMFDSNKAFGSNRHQATFPRGMEPLPQGRPFASQSEVPKFASMATQQAESSVMAARPSTPNFFESRASEANLLFIDDSASELVSTDGGARSVWGNDPPIHESRLESTMPRVPTANINSRELFGDDFEEEIAIAKPVKRGVDHRDFAQQPAPVAAAEHHTTQQAAVAEQLAAMESQRLELDDTRPYEDAEQAKRYATAPASDLANLSASWTVDVAASESARENALHMEIEDLVSQLNFSAFAVEPFSVEQIAIDYARTTKSSKPPQSLPASQNDRESIYTLHTSESTDLDDDIHSNLTLDDDRDMLIIEEELPVSNRMTTEQMAAPVVKSANYSQLFAKLRH